MTGDEYIDPAAVLQTLLTISAVLAGTALILVLVVVVFALRLMREAALYLRVRQQREALMYRWELRQPVSARPQPRLPDPFPRERRP